MLHVQAQKTWTIRCRNILDDLFFGSTRGLHSRGSLGSHGHLSQWHQWLIASLTLVTSGLGMTSADFDIGKANHQSPHMDTTLGRMWTWRWSTWAGFRPGFFWGVSPATNRGFHARIWAWHTRNNPHWTWNAPGAKDQSEYPLVDNPSLKQFQHGFVWKSRRERPESTSWPSFFPRKNAAKMGYHFQTDIVTLFLHPANQFSIFPKKIHRPRAVALIFSNH
jgi:hypothetical protein